MCHIELYLERVPKRLSEIESETLSEQDHRIAKHSGAEGQASKEEHYKDMRKNIRGFGEIICLGRSGNMVKKPRCTCKTDNPHGADKKKTRHSLSQ